MKKQPSWPQELAKFKVFSSSSTPYSIIFKILVWYGVDTYKSSTWEVYPENLEFKATHALHSESEASLEIPKTLIQKTKQNSKLKAKETKKSLPITTISEPLPDLN